MLLKLKLRLLYKSALVFIMPNLSKANESLSRHQLRKQLRVHLLRVHLLSHLLRHSKLSQLLC